MSDGNDRGGIAEENTMTDVTKLNFLQQSNDLIRRLPTASWIAVDEEMTGISLPDAKRPRKDDTPSDRYSSLKLASERYSIIQLGICLFEEAGTSTSSDGIETMKFHVRRYKFTLFPPDDNSLAREITFNPSSIHFLAKNNMDFNFMVHSGIPYATKEKAEKLMDRFYQKELEADKELEAPKTPTNGNTTTSTTTSTTRRVHLIRDDDKRFHARSMANLREWLDAAISQNLDNNNNIIIDDNDNDDDNNNADATEGVSMLLPPCNSFLRRALYESIEKEYPNLIVETSENSQLRVLRLNEEEKKQRRRRLQREGWEKLLIQKIGVYRVFLALSKACGGTGPMSQAEHMILAPTVQEAMQNRKEGYDDDDGVPRRTIPLVVHNGLQDLFFLLTHFHHHTLPPTWAEAKQLIHSYFPVVYDTKCMALQFAPRANSRGPTHLSAVYEETLRSHPHWNRSFQPIGGRSTTETLQLPQPAVVATQREQQEHDAAWDAYMTGAAFCGLVYTIHDATRFPATSRSNFKLWNCDRENKMIASMYGRNKLHFHLSPFTIDLESPHSDPLGRGMSLASTFSVADIDPSVSTRDIVRCLTGMSDSRGDRVNFEIIWVDDTSFLAGAMLPNCQGDHQDELRFREHGKIVLKALRDTFNNGEKITSMEELAATKYEVAEKQSSGSIWNLWGIFLGKAKERGATTEEEEPVAERASKRRRLF
eukprot:scaffold397_cov111-Cylindrotheca_fusiformis.AAC.2